MQVTSLLSRAEHEHDESCVTCGHDHEHAPVRLWQTLVGVVFVLNAFIVDWAFDQGHTVASASGLIPRRIGSADYAESQRGRDRSGSV